MRVCPYSNFVHTSVVMINVYITTVRYTVGFRKIFFTYQYLHLLYKSICLIILSDGFETMHEIYFSPDIPQIINLTYEYLLYTSLFLSAIRLFLAFKYMKFNDLLLVDVVILVYLQIL